MSEAERATGRMPWKGAKAMKSEAIRKICEEKQIRMIDFKMTDIDGRWRHITIPVERFEECLGRKLNSKVRSEDRNSEIQ